MTVLACVGHWYLSLLYVAPVAVVVGGIKIASVKDKRREAAELAAAVAEAPERVLA